MILTAAAFLLFACGPGEPPKPTPAKASATEAKKEETHAPDTHGMPGMSELFKSDDKKDEKGEKK